VGYILDSFRCFLPFIGNSVCYEQLANSSGNVSQGLEKGQLTDGL